jgi:hypothetical protein
MRVRHQRAGHSNRQRTGVGHLLHRVGLETFTPLPPGRELARGVNGDGRSPESAERAGHR